MTGTPISRRRALGAIVLGTAGVTAGGAGLISEVVGSGSRFDPATSGRPLAEPMVLSSRNGVLDVELTAARGVVLAGRDTSALGFNATSPGPTLRVAPADLLRIRLINDLAQPTNLHTHGLHVAPEGNGDNPFVRIEPGTVFDYAYRIPAEHAVGTHWYHPHQHGTVAAQLFGGLAGALLIDQGPDLPVSADRVLLISDITLNAAGGVVEPSTMERMMGREGELLLVNGQHQPVIPATPGSAQRWRIINTCTSRVLSLRVEQQVLTQVAVDGIFLPTPVEQDQIVLAPGNRADVVLRPTHLGEYRVVADSVDRGDMGMMGPRDSGQRGSRRWAGPIALATVAVTGPAAQSPPLPATLPAPPVPQGPPVRQRRLTFAMGMRGTRMGRMSFTIDGRTYDAGRDDQTVRLGTTEDWTLTNTSPLDHPFHLHVWPFHVLADSMGTPRSAVLQDVVVIPAHGWVRIRIPFTDHSGRTVYHCHILDHEDEGMMGTVKVIA